MAARRSGRRSVFGAVLAAIALVMTAVGASASPPETQGYIVVLDANTRDVPAVAADLARAHGGQVGYVYEHALKGFSIQVSERAAAALARNPRVAYVEPDRVRTIQAQTVPTGIQRIFADTNAEIDIDGTDDYRVDVGVAVIDTGIDFEHPDLNVVDGRDCTLTSGGGPPWARTYYCGTGGTGGDDDHYHGTHVAGTIAALDNGEGVVGVAPGARLYAVKVLDSSGSGYESGIVAGIDWVASTRTDGDSSNDIHVANMSLGGSGYSQAEYDAIQGAVDVGVAFAVAAGNSDADAKNYSPAAFDNVLTVSALADFDGEAGGLGSPTCRTDQDDTLADFSNWGSVVDIAAPGVCILSTYPIEQGSYGTISGTSMASPHAAGALALLASSSNPGNATDVYNLYSQVKSSGNSNWTDDSGDGIKEPLLDVSNTTLFNPTLVAGGGGDGGGTTNSPPTASLTYSCTDLACDFDGSGSNDSDGTIASYAWDFGDGSSASGAIASHTYAAGGTYTVTLTVTDDDSATDSSSQNVTVSTASAAPISLTVSAYKVKGAQTADLTWSGATSTNVDVHRNGSVLATTANDGAYTDTTGQKGGGSATYQVCEAGTTTCSSSVTVNW